MTFYYTASTPKILSTDAEREKTEEQRLKMGMVPVSSEIRHGVDIRHGLNSYSLRMTVCNAYG